MNSNSIIKINNNWYINEEFILESKESDKIHKWVSGRDTILKNLRNDDPQGLYKDVFEVFELENEKVESKPIKEFSYQITMNEFWALGLNKEFEMDRVNEVQEIENYVHWYVNTSKYSNEIYNKYPHHLWFGADSIQIAIWPDGDKFDIIVKNANLTHKELKEFIAELKRYNTLKDCKWRYSDINRKINKRGINLIDEEITKKIRTKEWKMSEIPDTIGISFVENEDEVRNLELGDLIEVVNDSDINKELRDIALEEIENRSQRELEYQVNKIRYGLTYLTKSEIKLLKKLRGYEGNELQEYGWTELQEIIDIMQQLQYQEEKIHIDCVALYGDKIHDINNSKIKYIVKQYIKDEKEFYIEDIIDELISQMESNQEFEEGVSMDEFTTVFDDFKWANSFYKKDEQELHEQSVVNKRRYKTKAHSHTDYDEHQSFIKFLGTKKVIKDFEKKKNQINKYQQKRLEKLESFHDKNAPKNIIYICSQIGIGCINPTNIISNELNNFERRMAVRKEM